MLCGNLNVSGHLYSPVQTITSSSGVATIDWRLGNFAKIQLTEDITSLSFTAPLNACVLRLIIIQDSTARTINWPGSLKFLLDLEPTLPLYANHLLVIDIFYDGSMYYAEINPSYTTYTLNDAVFENIVNGSASGNDFTSTGANASCTCIGSFISNGFVQYKLGAYVGLHFGLSPSIETAYTTIDYDLFIGTGGAIGVYENGVLKYSSGTAIANDILRVERINGNTIKYSKNGIVFYTSLTTSTAELLANIFMSSSGRTIYDVKIAQ